jgi:hypothetical protein
MKKPIKRLLKFSIIIIAIVLVLGIILFLITPSPVVEPSVCMPQNDQPKMTKKELILDEGRVFVEFEIMVQNYLQNERDIKQCEARKEYMVEMQYDVELKKNEERIKDLQSKNELLLKGLIELSRTFPTLTETERIQRKTPPELLLLIKNSKK